MSLAVTQEDFVTNAPNLKFGANSRKYPFFSLIFDCVKWNPCFPYREN